MIFEKYPPYMLEAVMEALIDIFDWYDSLSGTFMHMYSAEKLLQFILKFALDKLVM